MKKLSHYAAYAIVALSALLVSCGGDEYSDIEPAPAGDLQVYENSTYKYAIPVPENWDLQTAPKRVTAYSFSEEQAKRRFKGYEYNGYPIAKVDMIVVGIDSTRSFDDVFQKFQVWPQQVYGSVEEVMIDGQPGKKIEYTNEQNDGVFNGTLYAAMGDSSTATVVIFESFRSTEELYQPVFDEIMSSLVLAKTPAEMGDTLFVEGEELPPPSDTLTTMSGSGFTIQVPKNFTKSSRGASTVFDGERRGDSYIAVDITKATVGSSKAAAEKQNEAVNGTIKTTKINGQTVYYIQYNPTSSIKRRLYFVLSGDKIYRITLDWATEAQSMYLPVFEKSVATFKAG
jgi:hypothetical protein